MKDENSEEVGVWDMFVGVKREDCVERYPLG